MFDTFCDPTDTYPCGTDLTGTGPQSTEPASEETAVRGMSKRELQEKLCSQAVHMAVGECHLVLLIAELDRREAWAGQGICSCAHWLNWRCGTSIGTAREQVRVGRALEHLPLVRRAFSCGEVSYSKVRAITRIATAKTERMLVEWASLCSASQLERIVRAYRSADIDEGKKALSKHKSRYFRSYTDSDGMVVINARLSPEDGATVLGAIEAARQAMRVDRQNDVREQKDAEQQSEHEESASDVSAGTRVEPSDTAGPAERHEPGVDVSAETPLVDFESKEDDGADPYLVPLDLDRRVGPAEGPFDDWTEKKVDALVAVCDSVLSKGLSAIADEPRVQVLVHVDEAVLEDPASEGSSYLEEVGAVSSHTAVRLACDATVSHLLHRRDGSVEQVAKSRSVPRQMRRAVITRDGGCRYPGCTRTRFVDLHHVVFWSNGGATKPSNLVTLCRAHHRLVHEGGFRLEMDPSGLLEVWDPEGAEIPSFPPRMEAHGPGLAEQHCLAGVRIRPDALEGYEDRFDLRMTADCLLWEAAHGKEQR